MVSARGVVRDAGGAEIVKATVRISKAPGDEAPLAVLQTTSNGCFHFSETAPGHEKQFTLDVSAPGYKPVRLDFGTRSVFLLVILAPETSEQASRLEHMSYVQKAGIYEPLCVTFISHAASSLGPN
jgi:hypothetical protein